MKLAFTVTVAAFALACAGAPVPSSNANGSAPAVRRSSVYARDYDVLPRADPKPTSFSAAPTSSAVPTTNASTTASSSVAPTPSPTASKAPGSQNVTPDAVRIGKSLKKSKKHKAADIGPHAFYKLSNGQTGVLLVNETFITNGTIFKELPTGDLFYSWKNASDPNAKAQTGVLSKDAASFHHNDAGGLDMIVQLSGDEVSGMEAAKDGKKGSNRSGKKQMFVYDAVGNRKTGNATDDKADSKAGTKKTKTIIFGDKSQHKNGTFMIKNGTIMTKNGTFVSVHNATNVTGSHTVTIVKANGTRADALFQLADGTSGRVESGHTWFSKDQNTIIKVLPDGRTVYLLKGDDDKNGSDSNWGTLTPGHTKMLQNGTVVISDVRQGDKDARVPEAIKSAVNANQTTTDNGKDNKDKDQSKKDKAVNDVKAVNNVKAVNAAQQSSSTTAQSSSSSSSPSSSSSSSSAAKATATNKVIEMKAGDKFHMGTTKLNMNKPEEQTTDVKVDGKSGEVQSVNNDKPSRRQLAYMGARGLA